jgi:hypothetical protein
MEAIPFVHHLVSGTIDYLTKWNSPANKLHFPTRRHLYYALVRTLHEGSEATTTHSTRPPLPLELIIQILRDAECTVLSRLSHHVGGPSGEAHEMLLKGISPQILPAPDLAKSGWPLPLVNGQEIDFWTETGDQCNIVARDANPIRQDWFSTAPLSAHNLVNTQSIQLFTLSRDQGWVSNPHDGSWSWFDIILLPSERERDAEEHSWLSHNNGPPASTMRSRAGSIFGPSHEIWQIARIGDRIGVRACAQFGGWRNVATMALLILQEYFVPSFVPRCGLHTSLACQI